MNNISHLTIRKRSFFLIHHYTNQIRTTLLISLKTFCMNGLTILSKCAKFCLISVTYQKARKTIGVVTSGVPLVNILQCQFHYLIATPSNEFAQSALTGNWLVRQTKNFNHLCKKFQTLRLCTSFFPFSLYVFL